MMMFVLRDSKPGEPLLLHEEPIYLDNKIIGRTTSGNYSFCFDKNLEADKIKTTNVNILLNRVRLDQKRTLKKRIIFSIILASLVSLVAVYFIL